MAEYERIMVLKSISKHDKSSCPANHLSLQVIRLETWPFSF